jgi:hypothetical protein
MVAYVICCDHSTYSTQLCKSRGTINISLMKICYVRNVLQQYCVVSEPNACNAVLIVGRYAVRKVRRDAATNCPLAATESQQRRFAKPQ